MLNYPNAKVSLAKLSLAIERALYGRRRRWIAVRIDAGPEFTVYVSP